MNYALAAQEQAGPAAMHRGGSRQQQAVLEGEIDIATFGPGYAARMNSNKCAMARIVLTDGELSAQINTQSACMGPGRHVPLNSQAATPLIVDGRRG